MLIENQLRTLYPFCSGISVLTQYDRDWYGNTIEPDRTADLVLKFPELRDAFDGIVARAVEPSGKDYGALMHMKDLK